MKDRDLSSESFDPRSWGGGPPASPSADPIPAASAKETTSFDPSTWVSDASAPPGGPEPSAPAAALPPKRPLGRTTIAAASACAILAAGALAAYLSREETAAGPVASVAADSGAPAGPPPVGHSRRTVTLTGPEMVLSSLTDFGIDEGQAKAIAQQLLPALGSAPGEIRLDAQLAPGSGGSLALVSLEATRNDGSGVLLSASADGGYALEKLASRLETRILSARGEMDTTSFYSSAVAAGISDSVISDFAAAFSFDVDFQREVQPGDIFEAAFEQAYNPAGEPVGVTRLLFASLRLESKSLRLYRFKAPGQAEYGWFDANGRSNVRSLMRTPLDGARVSSKFGYRIHPVHGIPKLHRGTDFAAPVGTRIYASADGDVVTAGPNRCAGNMIRIQHEKGRRTHYFHLSAFAVQPGARVRQGEVIGLVGNTGTCTTGPHLHYEVWENEQPVDPLSIETGSTGVTLEGAALDAFRRERDRIDLARAQRVE